MILTVLAVTAAAALVFGVWLIAVGIAGAIAAAAEEIYPEGE